MSSRSQPSLPPCAKTTEQSTPMTEDKQQHHRKPEGTSETRQSSFLPQTKYHHNQLPWQMHVQLPLQERRPRHLPRQSTQVILLPLATAFFTFISRFNHSCCSLSTLFLVSSSRSPENRLFPSVQQHFRYLQTVTCSL